MDSDPLIRSYPDIGEKAFGCKGRALVSVFMYLELYLVAVEFLILEGDNLYKLFPNAGFKLAGLYIGGKTGFVLLTALVILPTTWLKSLGMLAYVSAGGVSASVILVGCVWWVGAVDGVGFHEDGVLLNWGGWPTTLSLFTFCYCGHAVFPTLCNSMKDRSQFSKVATYVETGSSHIWLYDNAAMLAISFQSKFVRSVVWFWPLFCILSFAGLTHLLRYKHHHLWINGSFRLPHVWRIFEVSSDLKPTNQKNGFKTGNIYHSSQSPDEVCGYYCSNRYCYWGNFCFPRQQISQYPRQNSDCDQHRGCGTNNSLFWIRDGFYRCIFERHCLHVVTLLVLPQDWQICSKFWVRVGVHCGNTDNRVFCGYNRYIYFNQANRKTSLKLKDGAIKLTDNKIDSSNAVILQKQLEGWNL